VARVRAYPAGARATALAADAARHTGAFVYGDPDADLAANTLVNLVPPSATIDGSTWARGEGAEARSDRVSAPERKRRTRGVRFAVQAAATMRSGVSTTTTRTAAGAGRLPARRDAWLASIAPTDWAALF
jgi:hypothetical protein